MYTTIAILIIDEYIIALIVVITIVDIILIIEIFRDRASQPFTRVPATLVECEFEMLLCPLNREESCGHLNSCWSK